MYSEKLRLGLYECEGAIKKKTGSSEMLFSQIAIEQGSPDAEGSLYGHKAKPISWLLFTFGFGF